MSNKNPILLLLQVLGLFSCSYKKKKHTHREDVSTISQTAELAFNAALLSQRLWRSHQFKWSMHKDMKSRVLELQSSQVATHARTHTYTQRERKLIFQPGMSLGSLELQRQQAFFFSFCGLLKIFAIESSLTEGQDVHSRWTFVTRWLTCPWPRPPPITLRPLLCYSLVTSSMTNSPTCEDICLLVQFYLPDRLLTDERS